ncbi:DUF4830 domain-containing protein [Brevibacillus sp. GCM10020057]|uniref:DUF4830 domain-containing protein n=1 Tax=Brevibacillus sp. GCM10020057 TaxID=3317327 RepID=UPI003634AB95
MFFSRVNVLILSLLMLILPGLMGCTSEAGNDVQVPKAHQDYITSYNWHVEKRIDSILHEKGFYNGERLTLLKSVGLDITPYTDSQIKEFIYLLRERQEHGKIYFHIYEVNDKIIGARLVYEGYSPGMVSLRKNE